MKIIILLIAISLVIAGGFLLAFFWAVRDGQYEDDYTPSMRILVDDDMIPFETSDHSISVQSKPAKNV